VLVSQPCDRENRYGFAKPYPGSGRPAGMLPGASTLKKINYFVMILSYRETNETVLPIIIEGIIVDKENNKPVSWTHIYIENSEEESLTTTDGEFKIMCWQKFPVFLIIKHVHFETVRIAVTCCTQRILVFLKEK